MKCIKCGKYPFCNKIKDSQQEACEEFIKKSLEIKITREEDPRIHKNANCRYRDERTAQDFMCELIQNKMVTCDYLIKR